MSQPLCIDLLDISLSGLDSPLEVTGNHPIWSMDRNEWIKAGELHLGEHLLGQAGQLVTVESITANPGTYTVYNMAVEGDHRYLVTNLGVVVHNACGGLDKISDNWLTKKGLDAHAFKEAYVDGQISKFNISIDKATNMLFLTPVKAGTVPPIETGLTLDEAIGIYPR